MIKYVIFDVGGVCYPFSLNPLNDWAFNKSYNKDEFILSGGVKSFDYNSYMKGDIDFEGFCKKLCKHSFIEYGKEFEIEIDKKLHEGVGDFYKETMSVMEKLKKKGIKVGLLSNALPNLSDTADMLVEDKYCFVSYELKCLKPCGEIYQKMLNILGCRAEDVVFVDDKEKNILGAKKLGIRGVVFDRKTIAKNIDNILKSENSNPFLELKNIGNCF